jgi:lipoprotein-anchoring transpeptidase ErfK/SrfK
MRTFMRSLRTGLVAAVLAGFAFATPVQANISVHIDISSQIMTIQVNGGYYATWKVSTARHGYYTPRGSFNPYRLERMHYSTLYENSPMPHSVFFRGNFAIHGTHYVKSLGRPASHGCVRLAPANAATLFGLIRAHGIRNTHIVISN